MTVMLATHATGKMCISPPLQGAGALRTVKQATVRIIDLQETATANAEGGLIVGTETEFATGEATRRVIETE